MRRFDDTQIRDAAQLSAATCRTVRSSTACAPTTLSMPTTGSCPSRMRPRAGRDRRTNERPSDSATRVRSGQSAWNSRFGTRPNVRAGASAAVSRRGSAAHSWSPVGVWPMPTQLPPPSEPSRRRREPAAAGTPYNQARPRHRRRPDERASGSLDLRDWPYRDRVTRIEIGFRALGTDTAWGPRFQVDDIAYLD
jgi:hypothetical protein